MDVMIIIEIRSQRISIPKRFFNIQKF